MSQPPAIDPGAPSYAHLDALTDQLGMFEHALFAEPRREGGYCVDDVARALIVVVREPDQTDLLERHAQTYLRFVTGALTPSGSHNRMTAAGAWVDAASTGDWWGRAAWGLGVAAASSASAGIRRAAQQGFDAAVSARSSALHATAFAALGAAEVARAQPDHAGARALLRDAADRIAVAGGPWPWPEQRLRYSNGSIADALISAGAALGDEATLVRGLQALSFLVDVESDDGHFSVTGSAGRGPSERSPMFDQQPLELAAIADAAAHALAATGDERWRAVVGRAWDWFEGVNDTGTVMWDAASGAGFDGLQPAGRNENRGAESTLAALSTYQQARRLGLLRLRGREVVPA